MTKRKAKRKKRQRQVLYSTQELMVRWEVSYETIMEWVEHGTIPEPWVHEARFFWPMNVIHGLGDTWERRKLHRKVSGGV